MKKQTNLITRCALIACASGSFCLADSAFAAEKPAEGTTTAGSSPKMEAKAGKENAGAQLESKDRAFMMQAGKDGMMEMHMGQMAQKQGQSAEVKKLGKMIETDHKKANSQLMALAEKKGVKLDTDHKMDKLDGSDFDQAWLAQMVKDHNKDIAAFQTQAKNGVDADLKNFANKTLPVLQKHLKAVQDLQGKMGSAAMKSS